MSGMDAVPLLPASSARGNGSPSKIIPRLSRDGWLTASVMTLFLSGFAGTRLLGGDFVRSGAQALARKHRPGAGQALSRDAALQRVRGDGVRRGLAAPLRVAVGVKHHAQHEGECEDRDDD